MKLYTVIKNRVVINGTQYVKGDKVDLTGMSDKDILRLIDQSIVIVVVENILPTDLDGLFAEIQKENEDLKAAVEKLKDEIAKLTSDLELKNKLITELDATKNRGRK